jgi:hypothetical protein
MAEHMQVRLGHPYPGNVGQVPQAPGGGVAVHPRARLLSRIGPRVRVPAARSMARLTAGGSGTRTTLLPAAYAQHPVAVFFAQVGDVRSAGFEDPQARQAEDGHEREVARMRRLAGGGEQSLELQVGEPEGR